MSTTISSQQIKSGPNLGHNPEPRHSPYIIKFQGITTDKQLARLSKDLVADNV